MILVEMEIAMADQMETIGKLLSYFHRIENSLKLMENGDLI